MTSKLKLFSLTCLLIMASCQNKIVDGEPQLGTKKDALTKRIDVTKAQIKANEEVITVFKKVKTGVRQIGSVFGFGAGSKVYTPFDTIKNIFEDFGAGIPDIKDKNQYIIQKDISIPGGSDNCKEFKVFAKLIDQKLHEKSLKVLGQELNYAIQGCHIKEKTKLLSLTWSKKGIAFEVESETIKLITEAKNYQEEINSVLSEKIEELHKNMECETQGDALEDFQFICKNISLKIYEDADYGHFIALDYIKFDSEDNLRFDAKGLNIVNSNSWTYDEQKGEYLRSSEDINKEKIFVKIYKDGAIDHETSALIDAVKNNPKVKKIKKKIKNFLEDEENEEDE